MRSSHAPTAVSAAFDDPNLVADAGLVPLVRLAERLGLPGLVAQKVQVTGAANSAGANAAAKAMSLVAAMCVGADSIDDVDRLRVGATTPGPTPGNRRESAAAPVRTAPAAHRGRRAQGARSRSGFVIRRDHSANRPPGDPGGRPPTALPADRAPTALPAGNGAAETARGAGNT